jgi:glycosyltransferase involved in cell wall biosynthesis
LYHQYAITIVPLLAGSGIRVRIIEGMAYGKCIVSTSIGAEGIPCEHNKNIIIADTPEDFAQEILDLLNNPNKVKSIQQEARKFAEENFSKEKVYLPLVKLYQQICNKLVC